MRPRTIVLSLLLTPVASADPGPSFNCNAATTPSEHAICNSPHLSSRDVELAAVWSSLRERGGVTEAEQRAQRAWITANEACTTAYCLAPRYELRILELRDVLADDEGLRGPPSSVEGHWTNGNGTLAIRQDSATQITAGIHVTWHHISGAVHMGDVVATAALEDGRAMLQGPSPACQLHLRFIQEVVYAYQYGTASDCDYGLNVVTEGTFHRVDTTPAAEVELIP